MGCHIAAQGTVDVIVMILYFKKSFLWAKIALHNEIKKKYISCQFKWVQVNLFSHHLVITKLVKWVDRLRFWCESKRKWLKKSMFLK